LHRSGELNADTVDSSVRAGSLAEVIVGMAFLNGIPIATAERALLKRDLDLS